MLRRWKTLSIAGVAFFFLFSCNTDTSQPTEPTTARFAVIGDYGIDSPGEQSVADLVKSWNPDFIITTGDNNYSFGAASTIDANVGKFYHSFIFPYSGTYGEGATTNRFYPSPGNHDWQPAGDIVPYLDYFTLPGNERYYSFTRGPVQFYALDSDTHEPDGITADSLQAAWLKEQLAASVKPFKIVYFHHSPYSSGLHGPTIVMQWPFKEWGADCVLSGHDHTYERIIKNQMLYFVNGLGGAPIYDFVSIMDGSQSRYNGNFGAMLVEITEQSVSFKFYNINNELIDAYNLPPASQRLGSKFNWLFSLRFSPS